MNVFYATDSAFQKVALLMFSLMCDVMLFYSPTTNVQLTHSLNSSLILNNQSVSPLVYRCPFIRVRIYRFVNLTF